MEGQTNTVTIKHYAQTKDSHRTKVDAAEIPADTVSNAAAMIGRNSRDNLWKIIVEGNLSAISKAPKEWSITDDMGRIFNCQRATYRAPIERLAESEHTLIFAELVGETDTEARL